MNTVFTFVLVLVALGITLVPLSRSIGRRLPPRITRLRELEDRYRSALADLQDDEADRELGNLADVDYEALRSRHRLRAAGVLAEITSEMDARARLAGALRSPAHPEAEGARATTGPAAAHNGRGLNAEVPHRSGGLQGTLLWASALAILATGGITFLYTRLVTQQEAQAPLASLPIDHAHSVVVASDDTNGLDLWVAHHNGVLRSPDGRNWASVLPTGDFMGLANLGQGRWLAVGHEVVWQSTDDARTWASAPYDLPDADIHGAQAIGRSVYAYVVGYGIFVTQDGARWEFRGPAPAGNVSALAALLGTPDVLFLAEDGKVIRSPDGGRTWTDSAGAGNLAITGSVRAVAADPAGNVLLAATSDGLFKSTTAGGQWIRLPFKGTASAVGVRGQTVGVVDDQNQFFLSRDGGATWAQS